MKRLFLVLTILLFTTSAFAQTGSPVQFSGGGKFKGGTLTSNLTMSDGTIIELATGSTTNLSLRFRYDTDTGIYSPSENKLSIFTGGSVAISADTSELNFYRSAIIRSVFQGNNTYSFRIDNSSPSSSSVTYGFVGCTNSGLYLPVVNQPAMVASGTAAQRWSTNGTNIYTNLYLSSSTTKLGIGTDTPDCSLQNQGFSRLGDLSPRVKFKVVTGITGAAEGNTTNISLGLPNMNKVWVESVLVEYASGAWVPPNYISSAEYEYYYQIASPNLSIGLANTNSGNILNKNIRALVAYEE